MHAGRTERARFGDQIAGCFNRCLAGVFVRFTVSVLERELARNAQITGTGNLNVQILILGTGQMKRLVLEQIDELELVFDARLLTVGSRHQVLSEPEGAFGNRLETVLDLGNNGTASLYDKRRVSKFAISDGLPFTSHCDKRLEAAAVRDSKEIIVGDLAARTRGVRRSQVDR